MKVNLKDYIFPSIVSGVMTAVAVIVIDAISDPESLKDAFERIMGIWSGFAPTFLGFVITAFTIIQVLGEKEWFARVKNTAAFKAFIFQFDVCIILTALLFFASIIISVAIDSMSADKTAIVLVSGIGIFFIVFVCAIVIGIVRTLMTIFQK